jgi:hypothetical protein
MATKIQSKKQTAKARKAPGNVAALQQKAADNVKRLRNSADKAETITIVKNTADGAYVYVEGSKGSHFARLRSGDSKEFRSYAAKGALYDKAAAYHQANPAPKPQAKLARGVEGKMTENSRKAVEDQRKAAPATKAANTAAPKASKNKAPARGVDRDYTVGKTEVKANPDSWRHHMLTVIRKHTNTAKAKAAHEKSGKFSSNKLDFNWAAAQGYIVWAK